MHEKQQINLKITNLKRVENLRVENLLVEKAHGWKLFKKQKDLLETLQFLNAKYSHPLTSRGMREKQKSARKTLGTLRVELSSGDTVNFLAFLNTKKYVMETFENF